MTTEIERRSFSIDELRIETRDGKTRMHGHAAVFNALSEDLGGYREQILAGAFAEAITKDDIRALWNHNPDFVLGRNRAKTLILAEDSRGLAIEIIPPDTQFARDLMQSIERGDVDQMSFAFSPKPGGQDWAQDDEGRVIRTLKNVRLFDVSPVTYPAYTQTDIGVREMRAWQATLGAGATSEQWRNDNRRRRLALAA